MQVTVAPAQLLLLRLPEPCRRGDGGSATFLGPIPIAPIAMLAYVDRYAFRTVIPSGHAGTAAPAEYTPLQQEPGVSAATVTTRLPHGSGSINKVILDDSRDADFDPGIGLLFDLPRPGTVTNAHPSLPGIGGVSQYFEYAGGGPSDTASSRTFGKPQTPRCRLSFGR